MQLYFVTSALFLVVCIATCQTVCKGNKIGSGNNPTSAGCKVKKRSKMAAKLERFNDVAEETREQHIKIRELERIKPDNKLSNDVERLFKFTTNLCKRPPNPFPGCRRVDKEEFRHNLSILNLYTNGRLGNQMSTFATLYAYTRLLRLRPVLYKDQLDSLSFYFPKVAEVAPAIEDVYCDPCEMPWEKFDLFLKSPPKEKTYEQGRAFGMTSYHQNPAAYKKYLPDMKTFLFRIEDRFTNEALAKLGVAAGVPVIGNTDLVLVGVHVRRTDYVGSVRKHEGNLATARYFGKAMDYFRNKYKKGKGTRRKLMFVVVSDDMEWCRKNIVGDDVAMLGNHMGSGAASTEEQAESLGVDLGLMLQCHHAIISHGTLGMWIGMLVGGETVMADDANMREPLEEVTLIRRANLGWKFMDYS